MKRAFENINMSYMPKCKYCVYVLFIDKALVKQKKKNKTQRDTFNIYLLFKHKINKH